MSEIKPAEALAKASWVGDNNVIPYGSPVDVLAIDHGGRLIISSILDYRLGRLAG